MSKLETNTIDTISGSTTLTLGGTNATTIAQDSATTITGLKSTGIDDNATSTAITIDSSENVGIGTTSPASLGANITTLEITGGSTIRQGGVYLSNSDKSVKSYIYGSNTATNLGTETNIPLVLVTNNTERMRIDSSGLVSIGSTSTNARLLVTSDNDLVSTFRLNDTSSGSGGKNIAIFQRRGTNVGFINVTDSSTSFVTSSDHRLKENVVEITDATSRLKQLKPKRFNFIANADKTVDGFLAHEVSSIVPEAISGTYNEVEVWKEGEELPEGVSVGDNKLDENGNTIPVYQGIDQSKLVPLLVKTIQELEARITELENA
jgi:hypothetical protein